MIISGEISKNEQGSIYETFYITRNLGNENEIATIEWHQLENHDFILIMKGQDESNNFKYKFKFISE